MSQSNPNVLPASMALLGLVIERPNQTVSEIARAFDERFERARFVRSTAYTTLQQMSRGRSVRVKRTYEHPGDDRTLDCYAPTELGRVVFREWMLSPPGTPAVREAIYGRIELARTDDLSRLIEVVRQEEHVAISFYEQASRRLRAHETGRRERQHARRRAEDVERAIRSTLLYVDPLFWSSRASLCGLIIERLEEIAEDAGIDLALAPPQADHDERPPGSTRV